MTQQTLAAYERRMNKPPEPTELDVLSQLRGLVLDEPCMAVRLMREHGDSEVVRAYVLAHVEHAKWDVYRFFMAIAHLRPYYHSEIAERLCQTCNGTGWSESVLLTDQKLPELGRVCSCNGTGKVKRHRWIGFNQSFYSIGWRSADTKLITIKRSQWQLRWYPGVRTHLLWPLGIHEAWQRQSLKILHRMDVEACGQLTCDMMHSSRVCKELAVRIRAAPVYRRGEPDHVRNKLWTGHHASRPHPFCWCAMCTKARYGGMTDHEGTCEYCPGAIADANDGTAQG